MGAANIIAAKVAGIIIALNILRAFFIGSPPFKFIKLMNLDSVSYFLDENNFILA